MTEESLDEWKIHQIVQNAVESAHSNPSPQTIKMFDELNKDIKEMKNDIKDVLIQATKTNGRVNWLEEWSKETKAIIESIVKNNTNNTEQMALINQKHDSDVKYVTKVSVLAVSIATFFIGTIGYLFQENIKNYNNRLFESSKVEVMKQTAQTVVETLESKYDLEIK